MVRKNYVEDLIPRKIREESKSGKVCETADKVWIPDKEDYIRLYRQRKTPIDWLRESSRDIRQVVHKTEGTDFVILTSSFPFINYDEEDGVNIRLRSNSNGRVGDTDGVFSTGYLESFGILSGIPLCISINLKINPNEKYDIYVNKRKEHILRIGEYLSNKVGFRQNELLEQLYNSGNLADGFKCTGRWYSYKGGIQGKYGCGYNILKHAPEFEYHGRRYARVIAYDEEKEQHYVEWLEVEPIEWLITNWDELNKKVNPYGRGRDNFFELITDKAVFPGICFYPNFQDGMKFLYNFWQNSTVRGMLNGINVMDITENGNPECALPNGGDYSDGCSFIEEAFHLDRDPMIEYAIPEWQKQIPDDCFNGCVSLKKIVIHSNVNMVGERAFDGVKLRYFYKDEDGYRVFAQDLPKDKDVEFLDLDDANNAFSGFDYKLLITGDEQVRRGILELAKFLSKKKIKIPYPYALALVKENKTSSITENTNFRFFRKEFKDINNQLLGFSEEESVYFYSFAYALGCFSDKKVLDDSGKETNVYVAQKACSALARIMKMSERTKLGNYTKLLERHEYDTSGDDCGICDSLSVTFEGDFSFLKLVTEENGKVILTLLELEEKYPGIFLTVFKNFDKAKAMRRVIDDKFHIKKDVWENSFKRIFLQEAFENIEPGNEDVAELVASLGLGKEYYDRICELRCEAEAINMPHHILGRKLQENVISDEIAEIRKKGEEDLRECVGLLDELYSKKFSYEWLDKYDPINGVLGMYVGSCAVVLSGFTKHSIADATLAKHDVQNLVLRNANGAIAGKISAYINKEHGYVVLNEPCLDDTYSRENGKSKENMKLITEAFARGIQDFLCEYDAQNPDNPIKQINFTRNDYDINPSINVFEAAKSRLDVPEEYDFKEAMRNRDQYVIYRRDASKNKGVRSDDRNEDER